ncbi:MAG: DUF2291 domain-containing protein [Planctomycetaceae bacterium]|nr:DUF2291 domain-containing protein [Planctomycetaceae bacterium]
MRWVIAVIVFVVFLALSATPVKQDPARRAAASASDEIKVFFAADTFDAEGYVDNIWDARVIPYVKARAVDLSQLLADLRADPEAAGERYGYRAVAEQNPYNFAVKGRMKILSANVKSRNGRVEADIAPYDGEADVTVQLGPIFKDTSIRDLLDFVSFDDFKNQVEFAKLATQLNTHAHTGVVVPSGLLEDGGVGREFDFIGATTQSSRLSIVPLRLVPVGE